MADNKNVTRQLSIFINDKQVVNSLSGIGKAIRQTNQEIRHIDTDTDGWEETLKGLQDRLSKLTTKQTELKEEIHGTSEEMEAAASAWGNLFNGLMTGNLTTAAAGLSALKAGIIGTSKAMLAFIATPIGAAIAGLAAIALATKEWFDYNKEVSKANKESAAITKLSGEELDKARVNAKALAETFDQDFKEVLNAASAQVNEFGISYDEAFKRIENGLIKGGYANEEFLESMREYPTFFAQAGFSAEQFQNILNTGADLSIYQDKLPDAIKEFALSVNEQTPAVREALQNAFGEEFTDKLLGGVKDGTLSVKEALYQVSAEANRLGLNVQQNQQLTADLFRGAGEDAGGALKIFDAINQSIENQKRPLSEVEQAYQDLIDSEKEAAEWQDKFLKSDGFSIWEKNVKETFNNISSEFYKFLYTMTNSSQQVANDNIKELFKATEEEQAQFVKESEASFEKYAARQQKILGAKFNRNDAIKQYIAYYQKSLEESDDENYKTQMRAAIKHLEELSSVENKHNLEVIQARKKASDERLKEMKAAHKKEEAEKQRALEAFKKGEEEINELIAKAQSDRAVGQLTGLKKEIAQIEARWAQEREKYKEHKNRLAEIDAEKDADIQAAKAAKAKEYGKEIDDINAELERDREALRLDKAAAAAVEDEDKQAILLEKARFLADWEIQTQMEKELALVEDVENAEAKKQAIRDKYSLIKQQNDFKFSESEKAIRSKVVDWTKLTEEQKLDLIKSSLNGASEAFNKGSNAWKAIKIAETTITTYQAAMNSYNALAGIPVIGPALGAVAAALAVVTGIKQVQAITNTKIEKAPKFYAGGHTGNKIMFNDEYGGAVGVVHKNEWVAPAYMTQDPRYANTIAWLENERVRNNKFADGGQATTTGPVPSFSGTESTTDTNLQLLAAINRLNAALDAGIRSSVNIGYQEVKDINTLNDEINLSNNNGTLNS